MKRAALLATLSLAVAAGLPAQGRIPWGPVADRQLSLELARPSLDDVNLSFASFLLYPRVRVPISPSVAVVGELPWARWGVDDFDASGTVLGNPYFGFEFAAPGGLEGGVGARLPLGKESGDFFGFAQGLAAISDADRFEAWIEKTMALNGWLGYRGASASGFQPGFAAGATVFKTDDPDAETEAFADYRVSVAYREARLATAAEFSGRYVLTESGNLGERTIHQLTIGIGAGFGRVWPTLAIRIPLDDDLTGVFSTVLELGIVWPF